MDKIFSARLDVTALDEMNRVSRRLGLTKKEFLESAIRHRARELERREAGDVWAEALGAWARKEEPATTHRRSRSAFQAALERHHRRHSKRAR